jgi:signal transduction histidine kinase
MSIAELSQDRKEIMSCITMMRERVDTLNGFIEEIIDYSRNTRTEAVFVRTDILSTLQKVLEGLKYMENMERIRVDVTIPPGTMLVTDPGRLKIILNNLIGNAVKYHNLRKADPFIQIGLEEKNGHVEIFVKDNGQGIPKELQSRVFEMFYRGHESSKGSGLGLYIAREMTRKLEGDIYLESEKNKGSTFTIRLPAQALS